MTFVQPRRAGFRRLTLIHMWVIHLVYSIKRVLSQGGWDARSEG